MLRGMKRVRGVGQVAGSVLAVAVLLGGCSSADSDGGGGGGEQAESASSSARATVSVEEVPEETAPTYPPGPEGDIDRKADAEGWTYDSIYGSASEFVDDICVSLPDEGEGGVPRAQWLDEGGYLLGDGAAVLTFGVPRLCPKWTKTVKAAVSGDYERAVKAGDWEVVADPAPYDPEEDVQQIRTGTYRAVGRFEDCYWERTSQDGEIVANQFVTQARELTVTLQAGDLFSNDCGVFTRVG
ncbi:hypothetical protein [Streptomyces caniscabiei]|uniref:hypothetical protein n=1 Tax=Streptomyces caniscabiei TaxID=2746961 RepID=UPI00187230A4|nr:hypothetical protein [Streptomyces caniscabiei]MBE4761731.1 hypothetical protein [Streptomyces caniscabiei]